jgi:TetR/AcrR family transcriptional regulator, regulator of cefoperazone and chloramphenicol sensitivity
MAKATPKKTRLRPGGDERRDSLVRAAFACLAADGFEGLRTRSVADRAGVNIATLHYYFPTKEALIGGVAEYLASQFITLHAPPVASTGKPALDRLHQEFADAHFYTAERPELFAVLFELQQRGRRDPAIRKIIEPLFGHWQYGIERFLAVGIEDGVFRSDLDPADGAALFVAALTGAGCLRLPRGKLDAIFAAVEAWLIPRQETPAAGKSANRAADAPDRRPRRAQKKRAGGK